MELGDWTVNRGWCQWKISIIYLLIALWILCFKAVWTRNGRLRHSQWNLRYRRIMKMNENTSNLLLKSPNQPGFDFIKILRIIALKLLKTSLFKMYEALYNVWNSNSRVKVSCLVWIVHPKPGLLLYIQHFDLLISDHLKDQLGLQRPVVWFNPTPLPPFLSLSSSFFASLYLAFLWR